jgi:hypothetical protein
MQAQKIHTKTQQSECINSNDWFKIHKLNWSQISVPLNSFCKHHLVKEQGASFNIQKVDQF